MKILFIVESPGKIQKISGILGKEYVVKASVGHFRNLHPKQMSIDFDNHFEPIFIVDKPDVVKNLKSAMKGIDMVYIASDRDREGEAIAQSLYEVLKPKKYKRLRYTAITKTAIMDAIKNASTIDDNLVNAQKARRVIDRLFGYLVSPILQRNIGGKLSAGRVQSPATRLIVDRENEIKKFLTENENSTFFRVTGHFSKMKATLHEASGKKVHSQVEPYSGKMAKIPLSDGKKPNINAIRFLKKCLKSEFKVFSVSSKIATRSAAPPFTTSTLQQEANRKFGMPIDATMRTAQKLYEAGHITYMRTDSVEISEDGHAEIKQVINKEYGKKYYQRNNYKSKVANSQEAHEAIRPTHPDLMDLEIEDEYQAKLYKLIWQRTIASQMKPAKIDVTTVQITISKYIDEKIIPYYYFQSQIEKVIFKGFMKVYVESTDDEEDKTITKNFTGKIPAEGDILDMDEITAKQEFLKPPPRYTQASLVQKLEKMEIGRPATFVSTVKTIMDRGYVETGNVPGTKKTISILTINAEKSILEETNEIMVGKESKKVLPTALGITVNQYLITNFPEMLDYAFTAEMEKELDEIAEGKKIWHKIVKKFYDKLKPITEELAAAAPISKENEKSLGHDDLNNEILATNTKYGPAVKKKFGDKFVYAKILEPLTLENITLEEAIELLTYPKLLGKHEHNDVLLQKGQFGLYLVYNNENFSIPPHIKEADIDLAIAKDVIKEKKSNQLGEFYIKNKKMHVVVLNGKFGPYIQSRGKTRANYPIPKNINPKKITEADILEIISKKRVVKKPQVT